MLLYKQINKNYQQTDKKMTCFNHYINDIIFKLPLQPPSLTNSCMANWANKLTAATFSGS